MLRSCTPLHVGAPSLDKADATAVGHVDRPHLLEHNCFSSKPYGPALCCQRREGASKGYC